MRSRMTAGVAMCSCSSTCTKSRAINQGRLVWRVAGKHAARRIARRAGMEEPFWRGIRLYDQRHMNGTASTDDLRRAMEQVSGQDLAWFFPSRRGGEAGRRDGQADAGGRPVPLLPRRPGAPVIHRLGDRAFLGDDDSLSASPASPFSSGTTSMRPNR